MLLAVFVAFVILCCLVICCSYCSLESKYEQLQQEVREQQESLGLPDDYEYEQDNIYMEQQASRGDISRRKVSE